MKQTIFTITLVLVVIGLLSVIMLGSRNKKSDRLLQGVAHCSEKARNLFTSLFVNSGYSR